MKFHAKGLILSIVTLALFVFQSPAQTKFTNNPDSAIIHTEDIVLFWKVFDATNPEFDKVIEALYAGADDIVDPGNGPEEVIEKTNQLLLHKTDGRNLLIRRLIQQIKAPEKGERDETDYGLTVKEKEILRLMKEAQHLKQIAQLTNSSYETVRTHVKHIYKKLGVMSASEAVIKAMKMDL